MVQKVNKFEDILCWQRAREFTAEIYSIFNDNKDFSFRDQIRRASVSIMNNIAEGFERSSNKEFKHFLFIAKGSCGEVRSMLYVAHNLKYITDAEFKKLRTKSLEISKMLSGFIKTLWTFIF